MSNDKTTSGSKLATAKVVTEEDGRKMKFKYMGIGAAGNKAVQKLQEYLKLAPESVIMVNSTMNDIPAGAKCTKFLLDPNTDGSGKERKVAAVLAINALQSKGFDSMFDAEDQVIMITSLEGGTGSGATPVLADYIRSRLGHTVHIIGFTGFENDPRGPQNTVEFFQDLANFEFDLQIIRNAAFMKAAGGNKFKAEELANEELCKKVQMMTGELLQNSYQNIDGRDLFKVVSTTGYKQIERVNFGSEELQSREDFEELCKKIVANTSSLRSSEPGALRMAVMLNVKPELRGNIDYDFSVFKETFGNPYEEFLHAQYDGGEQWIGLIVSGMKMPLSEVIEINERFKKMEASVDDSMDKFHQEVAKLGRGNGKFDISYKNATITNEEFFNKYATKP